MSQELTGRFLLEAGLTDATVRFGKYIEEIRPASALAGGPVIVPGFVDAHVHGGGGGDTMDGAAGVRTMARFHLSHGTTTIFPTTITNPLERVLAALEGVREVRALAEAGMPDIPGAHLEGPFISRGRLGAQPDFVLSPEPGMLDRILELDVVRVVTMAPEAPGANAAAERFAGAGVRVSLGHSRDDGTETVRLLGNKGITFGFTHLFNAMGGIEARSPGLAGAALASERAFAELIFDLQHVHPLTMRAALAALGSRLFFVTDAMRATGLGEGPTELGGQAVHVRQGRAELTDGTLAGSVLTMDQAFRNALLNGLSWQQAAALTSGTAARYLGLTDRGEIATGKRADLVVLDDALRVSSVYVAGNRAV